MKAISLHQPWASLVVLGAKRIETRNWSTSYRGPLLIHAAKKWTREQDLLCREQPFREALDGLFKSRADWEPEDLPRGVILGRVELVDCLPTEAIRPTLEIVREARRAGAKCEAFYAVGGTEWPTDPAELAFGDFREGRFGWLLASPLSLVVPLPYRGMQGLFAVSDADVPEGLR